MKKYSIEIYFINGGKIKVSLDYNSDENTILKQQQEVLEFINQKLITQENFIIHKCLVISKNVNYVIVCDII